MFTKIKQTKATNGGRFSCAGFFSASCLGATSLVGETTEVSSFCEATVVMGPTNNWEGYTGTTCDLHRFQRPVQRGGAEFEPDQFHHKSKVRQLQDQSKEIKYLHNQTQVYVIILSYPILYIWYESYVTSLYHHRGLSEDRDTPNSNELTMLNWDPYQNNWNSYWILT